MRPIFKQIGLGFTGLSTLAVGRYFGNRHIEQKKTDDLAQKLFGTTLPSGVKIEIQKEKFSGEIGKVTAAQAEELVRVLNVTTPIFVYESDSVSEKSKQNRDAYLELTKNIPAERMEFYEKYHKPSERKSPLKNFSYIGIGSEGSVVKETHLMRSQIEVCGKGLGSHSYRELERAAFLRSKNFFHREHIPGQNLIVIDPEASGINLCEEIRKQIFQSFIGAALLPEEQVPEGLDNFYITGGVRVEIPNPKFDPGTWTQNSHLTVGHLVSVESIRNLPLAIKEEIKNNSELNRAVGRYYYMTLPKNERTDKFEELKEID